MNIICDVDGVVADLHTPWLQRYNERSGDKLTQKMITSWKISDFVLPEWKQKIFDILREPDLYNDVQPYPQALDGVCFLRDQDHRVIFTTSCVKGMADQKWEWLERHEFLPKRYSHHDLVVTADKSLLHGDLIIDDSLDHVKAFKGDKAMLYVQPWNSRNAFISNKPTWFAENWGHIVKLFHRGAFL